MDCDEKGVTDTEDLMQKFKETAMLCSRLLNSSAVLKPQLNKSKFAPGFLKKFSDSFALLKQHNDTLLHTKGSFEASPSTESGTGP